MTHPLLPWMLAALALLPAACRPDATRTDTPPPALREGTWRATLQLPAAELPFGLEVTSRPDGVPVLTISNGDERMTLDEGSWRGDTLSVPLHIFDARLVAHATAEKLEGYFERLDTDAPYRVPFAADYGLDYRFAPVANAGPAAAMAGTWAVTFRDNEHTFEAVGLFEQNGTRLTGTFMTPTGDYRYLEGQVAGDSLQLSTFDGVHLYVFTAGLQADGTLAGEWFSGLTGYRTWTARRDPNAALPDADQLTALKPGFERLDFALPNLRGDTVRPDDDAYRGKVRVIQVFGTWCPNCMDETAFLAPWYRQNRDRGVEVIGLAFEAKNDFDYARRRIEKVVTRLDVDYPFLFAGSTSEADRAAALPAVDRIMSFPTTLFLDRQGRVRRIHTGFTGPGTGAYYADFVREFNHTIDTLLAEEPGA